MIQIVGILGGLVTQWLQGKSDEQKAVQEVKIKTIQSADSWDQLQAKGANSSWKDEWFTIVLSIPMILAFFPDAVPYIRDGFAALEQMPDYYKSFLAAAVAAAFGIRGLATMRIKK